jgi:ribosome-associated protein
MTLDKLQRVVVSALEDIKGQNIVVFDAQPLTSLFDRVVVVSGTSNRQTKALAKHLHDMVKKAGGDVFGAEGEESGEWVLVDLGDIVVHIMQPAIREYYRLEEIWGKYPIELKSSSRSTKVKSTVAAPKPAVKKPGAKPGAKKPAAKKPTTKSSSRAAKSGVATPKPAAKKPAPKKTAAKKSAKK